MTDEDTLEDPRQGRSHWKTALSHQGPCSAGVRHTEARPIGPGRETRGGTESEAIYLPGERLFYLRGERAERRHRAQGANRRVRPILAERTVSIRASASWDGASNQTPPVGWGPTRASNEARYKTPKASMAVMPRAVSGDLDLGRWPTKVCKSFRGELAPQRDGVKPRNRFDIEDSMTRAIARQRQPMRRPWRPSERGPLGNDVWLGRPVKGWGHRLAPSLEGSQRCGKQEANSV